MTADTKLAPLLYRDRGAYVRKEAGKGNVNIRERENEEQCPNCEGEHDEVYQYVEEHREEANLHNHDDRWFCLCGHTEVPSKGTTLEGWRDWRVERDKAKADTPPAKTVEMNSMKQTEAIVKLQSDVETLEQALLMIVAAVGPLGDLRELIRSDEDVEDEEE